MMGRYIHCPQDGEQHYPAALTKNQPATFPLDMVGFAAYGRIDRDTVIFAVLRDSRNQPVECDIYLHQEPETWIAVFDQVPTPRGAATEQFTLEIWDAAKMKRLEPSVFRIDKAAILKRKHRDKAAEPGEQGFYDGITISTPQAGSADAPTPVGQDFSAYGATSGPAPVTGSVTPHAANCGTGTPAIATGQTIYQSQTSGIFCVQFTGVTPCTGGNYYDVKATDGTLTGCNSYINVQ